MKGIIQFNSSNLRAGFMLEYDLTKMSAISMILCEIGRVNPVSVPVVIDEFNAAFEDS